jgi:hypothetical protein
MRRRRRRRVVVEVLCIQRPKILGRYYPEEGNACYFFISVTKGPL